MKKGKTKMKKLKSILGIFILILVLLTGCSKDNNQIELKIIEKEKAFLDEWGKGHTMIFPDNSTDEITYFDPSLEKRINGKKEFIELLKPIENKFTIERYEMIDPKVQVHGDVALLSYNLVDYSKDQHGAEKKFLWNSTEVYKRLNDDWRIIHSHWSFTKPELKQ